VGLFAPRHGEPKTSLARPAAIYAASHAGDGSRRPIQTVTPLAEWLELPVHSKWGPGAEDELARDLAERTDPVLVAWHHEAIPKLVKALGYIAVPEWPDDRFDVVWTLTRVGAEWRFTQVPQLLLAGDLP
jgi:hypothetical protein